MFPKSNSKSDNFYKNFKDLAMAVAPSSLILFLDPLNPPKLIFKFSRFFKPSKAVPQALAPSSLIPLNPKFKTKVFKLLN